MLANAWYIKLISILVIVFIGKVIKLVFCDSATITVVLTCI